MSTRCKNCLRSVPEALFAHFRQLGGILERFSDAFVALDKNWRYTYVNQKAADLFGRRPEDLIW
jgi:PAS domain-containing protein